LRHDRQKKRLTWAIVLLTAFAVSGGVAAGRALKRSRDDAAAADARLRGIEGEKDRLEAEQARLRQAIGSASDPGEVARLQQQLADAQRQLRAFTASSARAPTVRPPTFSPAASPRPSATARAPDACPKGDPLCPTIE
jgi:ATP-dependent DNA ligase